MSAYMQKTGINLFRKHIEQYTPPDPVYEYYTDPRGKQHRKKRTVPPGLSTRDTAILKSVQRRARCLDKSFNLCGLRFGWAFVLGIVPVAGDVACAALNYVLVVRKARQADLPSWLVARMLLHNAIAAGAGFVPLVGDVVVAVYKPNSRNAALLEEFMRVRGEVYLNAQAEKVAEERRGRSRSPRGSDQGQQVANTSTSLSTGSGTGIGAKETVRSWSSLVPSMGKRQGTGIAAAGDRGRFIENIHN